jgi:hypothetical protein
MKFLNRVLNPQNYDYKLWLKTNAITYTVIFVALALSTTNFHTTGIEDIVISLLISWLIFAHTGK